MAPRRVCVASTHCQFGFGLGCARCCEFDLLKEKVKMSDTVQSSLILEIERCSVLESGKHETTDKDVSASEKVKPNGTANNIE